MLPSDIPKGTSRYPGEAEDVTKDELSAAIDIAERVVAWASEIVAG